MYFILTDKFIKDDETRERLSNILCDNMKLMEEYLQRKQKEWNTEGFEEGYDKRGWEVAKELLNDNLSTNRISQITNIPIDQIELLNNNKI